MLPSGLPLTGQILWRAIGGGSRSVVRWRERGASLNKLTGLLAVDADQLPKRRRRLAPAASCGTRFTRAVNANFAVRAANHKR